jgi:hypothetical protein
MITSVALMITVTLSPAFRSSDSSEPFVIAATTIDASTFTTTSALTAPVVVSVTVPAS